MTLVTRGVVLRPVSDATRAKLVHMRAAALARPCWDVGSGGRARPRMGKGDSTPICAGNLLFRHRRAPVVSPTASFSFCRLRVTARKPPCRSTTTGFLVLLAGVAVAYSSKRQPCIAMSSTEAEIIAASSTACEAVYVRTLLTENVQCGRHVWEAWPADGVVADRRRRRRRRP